MPRALMLLIGFGFTVGSMLPPASSRSGKGQDEPGIGVAPGEPEAPEVVTAGGPLLFVVGNTTLGAGDSAVKTRLESMGFTVTVKNASGAQTSDANCEAIKR